MAALEPENLVVFDEMFQVYSETFGFTIWYKTSENKPKELCKVVVISGTNERLEILENHLKTIKLNCEVNALAQTIIEETEKVFKMNQNKDSYSDKRNSSHDNNEETVCKYFLEGTCRFGDKCFNSHSFVPGEGDVAQAVLDLDESEKDNLQTKSDKKKKKRNGNFTESEKPKKKTPMKTATDVINRIQWDEKLNPEDFTVGYLDRFCGVIENSYSSFNWEDITSVDQTILAIPRHRIQYFKYLDEVVWDKNKRLDCVFGSTGSGQTILDIIEKVNQENNVENH